MALILGVGITGCKDQKEEAAMDLLQAFSTSCKSQGDWTQLALSQSRALEATLINLQSRDECSGVTSALPGVQDLRTQIQSLATDPVLSAEKEAEEVKRQILMELNSVSDSSIQAALMDSLAGAEVSLAEARARSAVYNSQVGQNRLINGLTQLSSYLGTLMSSGAQLGDCMNSNPMLGVQLGAGTAAIAGAFVNPAVGVALSISGQLLSSAVDYARREKLDDHLDQVRAVQLEAALACGLESMASTYCEAQDLSRLIQIQAQSYPAQWKPTEFWAGLDLWSKQVPGLIRWFARIASGVTPSDPASADRQNEAWQQVHAVQSIERKVEGLISETQRLLNASSTGGDSVALREQTTRQALKRIVDLMYGNPSRDGNTWYPISQYYTRVALLYRIAQNTKPPANSTEWRTEDTIELPQRGFADIIVRARLVFSEVSEQLLAKLHLVIDVDPSGIVREALQPEVLGSESPLGVMRRLIAFLDESARYFEQQGTEEALHVLPLIRDTQSTLNRAIVLVLTAPGTPQGDRDVIQQLFTVLNLIYGTDFISGRIYRHIKWDLLSRIQNGEIPQDVEEILRGSGRDAARELLGNSNSSLDELNQDISTAQSLSQRNAENFLSLFSDGFESALERLSEAADRAQEPLLGPNRPNRLFHARLCTLILTTQMSWPKSIDRKICNGAVLESIYPGIEETLQFNELESRLKGVPLSKRMCTYQRFLRRSRLYATKPSPRLMMEEMKQGEVNLWQKN